MLSGAASTCVHVAIATTLVSALETSPALANGVAFVSATACSYLLNTLWSFPSPLHKRTLGRFFAVSLIGLCLTMAISGTAQYVGASYWAGLACVLMAVPVFTYLAHREWTFRAQASTGT
nr:GtrA family protein [Cupriavidus sp. LEh25]